MVNKKKVAHQLKFDGMYNTIYIEVQDELKNQDPSVEEIEKLITQNEYFIREYKELNRYGEVSSVHAKKLSISEDEDNTIKKFKEKINKQTQELRNLEMFEVDSKNNAYSIWIGSAGVMIIFMMHNIIALFSEYYVTHTEIVYGSFAIVVALTYWSYRKMKSNHDKQHIKYKELLTNTRADIKEGLEKCYYTYDECFEGVIDG